MKDTGRIRISNDDCVLSIVNGQGDILLVVCDGMGGYKRGDFASKLIVDTLKEAFENHGYFFTKYSAIRWINRTIKNANRLIFEYAQEKEFRDMGSTLSLVLIYKNLIITAYAGDSRIYFYNKNKILKISEDQTYVEELYKKGEITREEMEIHPNRHTLTNAIGIFPFPNLVFEVFKNNKQSILLCSDGLYNNLTDDEMFSILSTNELIEDKAKTLIACANANGGSDNIAVVLWEPSND